MSELADALETLDRKAGKELDQAFAANYPDLKRIAHSRISRSGLSGQMQTTALVHDCYVKLADGHAKQFDNRLQFLAYASRTVRSIVLDSIREERAQRRGGGHDIVTLNTNIDAALPGQLDAETVNTALESLEKIDPALARLTEMRFFAGLTAEEIAEALGTSLRTVQREWAKARALLLTLIEN
ncbi:MAG: sigma-70 family RNA polymerase sigma factor [Betaproteobacteria bacterium]|nr:sigma-70 family RNA polymerase sigma factor [Betaproteobacteria bacterium]